ATRPNSSRRDEDDEQAEPVLSGREEFGRVALVEGEPRDDRDEPHQHPCDEGARAPDEEREQREEQDAPVPREIRQTVFDSLGLTAHPRVPPLLVSTVRKEPRVPRTQLGPDHTRGLLMPPSVRCVRQSAYKLLPRADSVKPCASVHSGARVSRGAGA